MEQKRTPKMRFVLQTCAMGRWEREIAPKITNFTEEKQLFNIWRANLAAPPSTRPFLPIRDHLEIFQRQPPRDQGDFRDCEALNFLSFDKTPPTGIVGGKSLQRIIITARKTKPRSQHPTNSF
jgi:hypothetical protein